MDGANSPSVLPSHPLRWFPEFLEIARRRSHSVARLLGSAILVGIVAGIAAVVFATACQVVTRYALDGVVGYRPNGPEGEAKFAWLEESNQPFRPWLLLIVPTIGGLVSGFLVFRFAPEAEGHGTDSVIAAYHARRGEIRARVPLVKTIASAITIGTGGSGGREGPIAQIGAGFGSVLGRMLHMSPAERRVLVAAGMGAGIAAIFRAPLAGALFASEVLYRSPEFESEVILPAGLASVVAYSTFGLFFGWNPLFATPHLVFENVWELGPYTLLALFMAVLAMLYARSFYWLTGVFRRLPGSRMLKPALGAFLNGFVGLTLLWIFRGNQQPLAVLSFGYGILQDVMNNSASVPALVLLAVALGKILTTGLTIGSGGSGGVFGPSMVIGGCGGGALGIWLHQLWPGLTPNPVSFMIVGMAGFFAAAAKTPFSTLVIVSELTGDYRLILPSLWVCALAYLLSDEQSLYQSQVEGRAHSPAHQGYYVREVLTGYTVAHVTTSRAAVNPLFIEDSFETVVKRFDETSRTVLAVVERDGRLAGVIHLQQLFWTATHREYLPGIVAADLMRAVAKPLTVDLPLPQAVELFVENDLPELPIVNNERQRTFQGMMRRTDIARAYLHRVHGRQFRSDSWR